MTPPEDPATPPEDPATPPEEVSNPDRINSETRCAPLEAGLQEAYALSLLCYLLYFSLIVYFETIISSAQVAKLYMTPPEEVATRDVGNGET